MNDLTDALIELVRLTSTSLPVSVESGLKKALEVEEKDSNAAFALKAILRSVEITRKNASPICQDTGMPSFYIQLPDCRDGEEIRRQVYVAVARATAAGYLRPNASDPLSGVNTGDNLGKNDFPPIEMNQSMDGVLRVDLLLKGGGCENVSSQYSLPDSTLGAERDLEGVRRCALDAVQKAQGRGCAPGILAVVIGGDRAGGYAAAKKTLLRDLEDAHPEPALAELESRITREANQLGIGPMGLGGRTTLLAAKISTLHTLPACWFVTVSYMCWAYRRRRLWIMDGIVNYE